MAFLQTVSHLALSPVERAVALLWWHGLTDAAAARSVRELVREIEGAGFGQQNVTRMASTLGRDSRATKSRDGRTLEQMTSTGSGLAFAWPPRNCSRWWDYLNSGWITVVRAGGVGIAKDDDSTRGGKPSSVIRHPITAFSTTLHGYRGGSASMDVRWSHARHRATDDISSSPHSTARRRDRCTQRTLRSGRACSIGKRSSREITLAVSIR
jgi:hypothetical protein